MVKIKIKKLDNDRIKLEFPFNRDIISKIKTIKGYWWHNDKKYWSFPLEKSIIEAIKKTFQGYEIQFDTEVTNSIKSDKKYNNTVVKNGNYIFTEVFKINNSINGKLKAHSLDQRGIPSKIGGKLSYQLRNKFKGHWVWANNKIISDQSVPEKELKDFLEELWLKYPDTYKDLLDIVPVEDWKADTYSKAKYIVNGLISDHEKSLTSILTSDIRDLGKANVERKVEMRSWIIGRSPATSLSISSNLIYKDDLEQYLKKTTNKDEIIGLSVADKFSSLKGEVVEIVGTLKDHRKKLLILSGNLQMQNYLKKAPDDELVVRVTSFSYKRDNYYYAVGALRIILLMENLKPFGINPRLAQKNLLINPKNRFDMVQKIHHYLSNQNLLGINYNSEDHPGHFFTSKSINFTPQLKFGGNKIVSYNEKDLLRYLQNYGIYRRSDKLSDSTIRIGVIDAIRSGRIKNYIAKLNTEITRIGFKLETVNKVQISDYSHATLENVILNIMDHQPHIIIPFFPFDKEGIIYNRFKAFTIGKDIASQAIYENTLDKHYAIGNILLGIIGKTGNIPYVLGNELEYADYVVGMDIARERKKNLPGTINSTAITRVYLRNGEFLKYVIHDASIEGETIPDDVLISLFPSQEFKDRKVVIHRDGYFRGNEKKVLLEWAENIEAKFSLVEVIKTGTPRIYRRKNGSIIYPEKGDGFKLSNREAFLVSSLPAFRSGTPQPLHIKTDSSLTIENAAHSVLSLTLLHYGSLRPPRLPVTIHYSDKIAYLALRGIKPKSLEGNIPFWL